MIAILFIPVCILLASIAFRELTMRRQSRQFLRRMAILPKGKIPDELVTHGKIADSQVTTAKI